MSAGLRRRAGSMSKGESLTIRHDGLAQQNVVVVGINYAPEQTGIAPYTTGLASHLARTCETVEVVTGVPHYPSWTVNPVHRWMLRRWDKPHSVSEGSPRVLRLRHYVPSRQSALRRALYEASFYVNARLVRIRLRPTLVIGVTPSLGGALAASRLARRYGAATVVVVQDLVAKAARQSGISGGGGLVARATGRVERAALTGADLVLIVTEAFRETVRSYGVPDERILLFPNWSHIRPSRLTRAEARQRLGWPQHAFLAVHTGNIGLKQDLGNLVEAARLSDASEFVLMIVGDGSQRAIIEAQAEGLANVMFIDPLSGDEYPDALAAADVLLINERPGVSDMSLPSKLTSYLISGRGILAAVEANGATAVELARTQGAAVLVDAGRPAEIVTALRRLQSEPATLQAMGEKGQEYAERHLGEQAAGMKLESLLASLLGGVADDKSVK